MDELNKNISLVQYQASVIVKGIERKLKELDYMVDVVENDHEKVGTLAAKTKLFIFYLPIDIMEDRKKWEELDMMITTVFGTNRSAILIGESEYREELVRSIPMLSDYTWFDRPLDMDRFIGAVDAAFVMKEEVAVKKRILIVDDDPSYASMVREWIKKEYRADIVTGGMQAITFLLKKPVDLILLDYEMPVVDGPQVLQMLRQEPATKDIPVVFLTGNGTKDAVVRVMELKPDGYLLKSTPKDKLLHFLHDKLKNY